MLRYPAPLSTQFTVHDGDLPGGPPKLTRPSLNQKRKASQAEHGVREEGHCIWRSRREKVPAQLW